MKCDGIVVNLLVVFEPFCTLGLLFIFEVPLLRRLVGFVLAHYHARLCVELVLGFRQPVANLGTLFVLRVDWCR